MCSSRFGSLRGDRFNVYTHPEPMDLGS